MAAAMTVTAQPTNVPPRLQIIVTGLAGTTVTITRTNSDGSTYQVRTANPGQLATAAWFDYEAPYGQTGTYTAVSNTGATISKAAASLAIKTPWLIHPGNPGLSMPVEVAPLGDRTRDVNQGLHVVLGRATPVSRTDGVRRSPAFDLTVRTRTAAAYKAFRTLIGDGATLLLQIVYTGAARTIYHFVSVGSVTERDMVPTLVSDAVEWTLPCTSTSSPVGSLQAQWTCAGVLATYASCSTVLSKFTTCTKLLTNTPTP